MVRPPRQRVKVEESDCTPARGHIAPNLPNRVGTKSPPRARLSILTRLDA